MNEKKESNVGRKYLEKNYHICLPTTSHSTRRVGWYDLKSDHKELSVEPVVTMSSMRTRVFVLSGIDGTCVYWNVLVRLVFLCSFFSLVCDLVYLVFWKRVICLMPVYSATVLASISDWLYHFCTYLLRRCDGIWLIIVVLGSINGLESKRSHSFSHRYVHVSCLCLNLRSMISFLISFS